MKKALNRNTKKYKISRISIKRKVLLIAALALLSAILIITSVNLLNEYLFDWKIVAVVDGEPIYVKEFKARMEKHKASTYSYFKQKHDVDDSRDFWTEEYSGETPLEFIRKETLDELLGIKVQQILFREKGLMDKINYKEFLDAFQRENKSREEAIENNQVIYGPQQYSKNEYSDYIFNNMVIKLKDILAKDELKSSDEELNQYYENHKKELYQKTDFFKLQKIIIVADTSDSAVKSATEEMRKRFDTGENIVSVVAEYKKSKGYEVSLEEIILEEAVVAENARASETLKAEAEKLMEGQVSEVYYDNGALSIIKCLEREDGGYFSFDEMKKIIQSEVLNDKYDEYVKKHVNGVELVVDEKVYKKVDFSVQ